MPIVPIRDYLYLAIILILAVAFAWDHYSGVRQGVARQVASDAKAAQVAQKAVEAQKLTDARTAQEATHGLEAELATLRAAAAKPTPVVRLCVSSPRRSLPAKAQPAGGASGPAPTSRELQPVPSGAGTGPDLGPKLRRLAEAADIVAARDRACIAWARGIAR